MSELMFLVVMMTLSAEILSWFIFVVVMMEMYGDGDEVEGVKNISWFVFVVVMMELYVDGDEVEC